MTGRANHAGQVSVPNVILRFSYIRHRSLSHDFFLLTFCGKSPRLGAAILIVHPEQRRADFLKLCDAVTVKPLVTRYTIPKQRKGADRYGSYEYESGAV